MDDTDVAMQLGEAGLTFLGWPDRSVPRVPASVARYAVCCRADEGRTGVNLHYSDSESRIDSVSVIDANKAWFHLSQSVGLFGPDNEFLVAVTLRADVWPIVGGWAAVRLAQAWDIAGVGASGLLGSGPGLPEFVMLSMDDEVIVQGTVWQDGIGFLAVRKPRRAMTLRREAEYLATWELASPAERLAARAWLDARTD